MWKEANQNPCGRFVGDCVIRALSIALGQSWEKTYLDLCVVGFEECGMPSANHVWGRYLEDNGFRRYDIPFSGNTVGGLASDLTDGIFILATGNHVVTVIDGDYCDAWDSGHEVPISVWKRRNTM